MLDRPELCRAAAPRHALHGDKEGAPARAAYRRLRVHGDFVNAGNRFFPPPVGTSGHFGCTSTDDEGEIAFDHLSWLVSADALRHSATHDGSGEAPGIRYRRRVRRTTAPSRVVRITPKAAGALAATHRRGGLTRRASTPAVPGQHRGGGQQSKRLRSIRSGWQLLDPQISSDGLTHESGAKKAEADRLQPRRASTGRSTSRDSWRARSSSRARRSAWRPHVQASRRKQQRTVRCRPHGHRPRLRARIRSTSVRPDDRAAFRQPGPLDRSCRALARLRSDDDAVARARADIAEAAGSTAGARSTTRWSTRSSSGGHEAATTAFYRLAWRAMIAPDTERSLVLRPSFHLGLRTSDGVR